MSYDHETMIYTTDFVTLYHSSLLSLKSERKEEKRVKVKIK